MASGMDADDTSESSSISLEDPNTEVTYVIDIPSPCSEDFDTDLEDSGISILYYVSLFHM
jgi:hypothetical protein